jgi:hypothetical protein
MLPFFSTLRSSGEYELDLKMLMVKVIGPQRIFAPGMIYSATLWFFLLGAILPVPVYLWVRKHPKHWFQYVHVPLIMGG